MKILGTGILIILSAYNGWCGVEEIEYTTPNGKSARALYLHPGGDTPRPAVIFNHGVVVENDGYENAVNRGYDLESYMEAIACAGYACIAPIREDIDKSWMAYKSERFMPEGPMYGRGKGRGGRMRFRDKPPVGIWKRPVTYGKGRGGISIETGKEIVLGAFSFLQVRNDIDKNRIAMAGFSKGGTITFLLAAEGLDIKAAVLISPPSGGVDNDTAINRLKAIKIPVFLTLGNRDDEQPVLEFCNNILIPVLKETNPLFEYKTGYRGGHKWFWKARPEHMKDVIRFLQKYLS